MAVLIKNLPNNPKNIIGNRGLQFPLQGYIRELSDLTLCPLFGETSIGQETSNILTEEGVIIENFCNGLLEVDSQPYTANLLIEVIPLDRPGYASLQILTRFTCYGNSISPYQIKFWPQAIQTVNNKDATQYRDDPTYSRTWSVNSGVTVGDPGWDVNNYRTFYTTPNWQWILEVSDVERGLRTFTIKYGSLPNPNPNTNPWVPRTTITGSPRAAIGKIFSL